MSGGSGNLTLGLRITGDATSAKQAAGEAEQAVKKVGTASVTAGEAAAQSSAEAVAALAAQARASVEATLALERMATAATTALESLGSAARATSGAVGTIGTSAVASAPAVERMATTGSAALKSLETQAQATGRTLADALGMNGSATTRAQAQAAQALAASNAKYRAEMAASEAAVAVQATAAARAVVQARLDEARASQIAATEGQRLAAAEAQAEAAARATAKAERDLAQILTAIKTPQQDYAEWIEATNTAFMAGKLSCTQYHDALAAGKVRLEAAQAAQSGLGGAFGVSMRGMVAFSAGYAALNAVMSAPSALIDTAAKFDGINKSMLATSVSQAIAKQNFEYLERNANTLGIQLVSSAQAFAQITAAAQGTALEGAKTRDIFSAVTKAGASLALSGDSINGALIAIGQMMSKGTVASEELRGQLGERLPGAFNVAARAMGMTTAEFSKQLDQGKVLAEDFLPKFATELDRTYASARFDGIQNNINRIDNAWEEFKRHVADSAGIEKGVAATAAAMTGLVQLEKATPLLQNIANNDFGGATLAQLQEGRKLLLEMGLLEQANSKELTAQILKLAQRQTALSSPANNIGAPTGGAITDSKATYDQKFLTGLRTSDEKAVAAVRDDIAKLRTMRDEVVEKLGQAKYDEIRAGLDRQLSEALTKVRATGAQYDALIAQAQAAHPNLPQGLIKAVIATESKFDPNARSKKGAEGLAQFIPSTAQQYGVSNPYDPAQAIKGAGDYLDHLFSVTFRGDADALIKTIAAYNAGEDSVQRKGLGLVLSDRFGDGETKRYVPQVLDKMGTYGNALAASVDMTEFDRRRTEAEARFKATLAHNVTAAENAAKTIAASQATALADLDNQMADRARQRATDLGGKSGKDLRAAELANQRAALADAVEYAQRKAEIEDKSLSAAIKAQQAKAQALRDERAEMARNLASAADLQAQDDKIASADTELTVLSERRRQAALKTSTDITNALAKEAAAKTEATRAELQANEQAISEAQQIASAKAQAIQAQVVAGTMTQGQAQEQLRAIYAASAQAIEGNVQALQDLAAAGNDPAHVLAAERAKAAWLDMLTSVRSPMEAMLAQWKDTTSQMQQASVDWANRTADALTDLAMNGKADFAGLAKSIIADIIKIEIQAQVVGPMLEALGAVRPVGVTGDMGSWAGSIWNAASNWFSAGTVSSTAQAMQSLQTAQAAQAAGWATNSAIPAGALAYSPTVNAGGMPAAYQSIGQQIAPSVATQAGVLPQSATAAGNTAGAGASAFGSVFGGFGAGMMAGGLAQSLGMRGTNSTANTAAPMVGSLAGAGIGFMVGGPVGALVGGLLGGLGGAGASMLFKSAIPHANALYSYANGGLTQQFGVSHAGGDLGALEKIGGGLADPFNMMAAQFGIDLGSFDVGMRLHGNPGAETLQITGNNWNGQFADITVDAEDAQLAIDKFQAALLKRKEVLRQFDDDLEKGAINAGDTLTAIGKTFSKVQALRVFEGERSSQAGVYEGLTATYRDYRNTIMQITGGVRQHVELAKLDNAYKEQFGEQVAAYQSALSAFGGGPTSTMADSIAKINATADDLRAQNKELEQAAKKSKGKIAYTPVSEADIESARQAALNKLQADFIGNLRQLTGAATPLSVQVANLATQFKSITADAAAASVSTQALGATLVAQYAGLVQSTLSPLLDERSNIAALKTKIAGGDTTAADLATAEQALASNTNTQAELNLIGQVRQAVDARYQSELSRLQGLQAAYQQVANYASGLKLSNVSPLTPAQRLGEAQQTYADTLAKAKTGDTTALSNLTSAADTYLKEAQARYASGAPYQSIFKQVMADTSALGAKAAETTAAITDLQNSTVGKLTGLDAKVGSALDYARQQLTAGLDTVGALGNLNDTQKTALKTLIDLSATSSVTSLALGALAANLQGAAATAISSATPAASTPTVSSGAKAATEGFLTALQKAEKGGLLEHEKKQLVKYLGRLNTSGYSTADWTAWRAVGEKALADANGYLASGAKKEAERARAIAEHINSLLPDNLRFFADGGLGTGWAMVGERGPELVNFSDPARVYTAAETSQALRLPTNQNGAGGAVDWDRLVEALAGRDDRANRQVLIALNRLLQAVVDGHAISEASAQQIAREVRVGLSRRAA